MVRRAWYPVRTCVPTLKDVLDDPIQPEADEVLLTAPTRTVVVFNSHTGHGGIVNSSRNNRGAMHIAFVRRDCPQQLDQKRYLRPETEQRLSPEARFLLDV